MIPLSLGAIAEIVGGSVAGDPSVTVTAPAAIDGRKAEPGGLFVAFAGEHVDGHDFAEQAGEAGAVAVLGSRPTALPTVVVDDVEAALRTLAMHLVDTLRDRLSVVAVTGSQGKTSTKDLVAAILSSAGPTVATVGNSNNELGVPLTVTRLRAETRYLDLEMGARYIGDIAHLTRIVPPDVAIVLNVGKAHLGKFGSQDAIATAKGELVEGLRPGGTAILNADDPRVLAMRERTTDRVLTFGRAAGADVRIVDEALDRLGRPSFTLATATDSARVSLTSIGAHQATNAAAAAAAALALGIPLAQSAEALGRAALTKWRMELHHLDNGAILVNDAYNASTDSMRAALDGLVAIAGQRRIAVLGPILELGDATEAEHRILGEYAATRADVVIAVGDTAAATVAGATAAGAGPVVVAVPDNETAIARLRELVGAGDVVLLKASRGARFEEIAAALLTTADEAEATPATPGATSAITAYDVEAEEAEMFATLAPRFGVTPELTTEPLSAANAARARGSRCVSVSHRHRVGEAELVALRDAGVGYLSTRSAGFDHIDLEAAARLGITVGNVAYSPDSVADFALMLMLMALRHAKSIVLRSAVQDYRLDPARGRELRDLTVGVIGTGRIGAAVIARLRAFGGTVLGYDSTPTNAIESVPLVELLRRSDVVTLHTPLTPATRHLLNEQRIALMKPGAVVVNTARGALIDTAALLAALQDGRLGGAALDVVEGEEGVFYADLRDEPLDNELLARLQALPNVIVSPHTAFHTDHALRDMVEQSIRNCLAYENEEP